MPFQHEFDSKVEIKDEIVNGQRFYDTPVGRFKSVTTIIGEKSDKQWLEDWYERVGYEEAEAIKQQAAVRGTAIHDLAEKYVLNDPKWSRGAMPVNLMTFKQIKTVLDENIEVVYGIEYPLYSEMLHTAGRSDLPAKYKGVGNAIVDFKTSKRTKRREDIPGYFIQATAYSLMYEELTGRAMPNVVIIMACDDNNKAQVFIDKSKNWYNEVHRIFCS